MLGELKNVKKRTLHTQNFQQGWIRRAPWKQSIYNRLSCWIAIWLIFYQILVVLVKLGVLPCSSSVSRRNHQTPKSPEKFQDLEVPGMVLSTFWLYPSKRYQVTSCFRSLFYWGFHGHGGTPKTLDGSFHAKSHRSKWMITRGTPMTLWKPPYKPRAAAHPPCHGWHCRTPGTPDVRTGLPGPQAPEPAGLQKFLGGSTLFSTLFVWKIWRFPKMGVPQVLAGLYGKTP